MMHCPWAGLSCPWAALSTLGKPIQLCFVSDAGGIDGFNDAKSLFVEFELRQLLRDCPTCRVSVVLEHAGNAVIQGGSELKALSASVIGFGGVCPQSIAGGVCPQSIASWANSIAARSPNSSV